MERLGGKIDQPNPQRPSAYAHRGAQFWCVVGVMYTEKHMTEAQMETPKMMKKR